MRGVPSPVRKIGSLLRSRQPPWIAAVFRTWLTVSYLTLYTLHCRETAAAVDQPEDAPRDVVSRRCRRTRVAVQTLPICPRHSARLCPGGHAARPGGGLVVDAAQ